MAENEVSKGRVPIGKAIRDIASTDIYDRVEVRLKRRLREVKELSSAKHKKIQRGGSKMIMTEPPKMHISNLEGSIVNGVGTITYDVISTDKNGNKVLHSSMQENSRGKEVPVSGSYVIEKQMIETIEKNKVMRVEELRDFLSE